MDARPEEVIGDSSAVILILSFPEVPS